MLFYFRYERLKIAVLLIGGTMLCPVACIFVGYF